MTTKPKSVGNLTWIVMIGMVCVIVFCVAFLLAVNIFSPNRSSTSAFDVISQQRDNADGITQIDPPRSMPDFTLTSHLGTPVSLHDMFGQPTIVFFGYTHCPDVCPMTLNTFKRIRSDLGNLGNRINYVFVSVDPDRDSPKHIAEYFETQSVTGIIGLTGDESDIRRIGADYGLHFQSSESEESTTKTLIEHTSSSFLLDRNGNWVRKYAFGTEPSIIVDDLREVLRSTGKPDTNESYTLPRL